MQYEQLSDEAKESLKGMVAFCINRGYCMGQDEGIKVFADEGVEEVKHDFRNELETFCGMQNSSQSE